MILTNVCNQFGEEEMSSDNASIFFSLLDGEYESNRDLAYDPAQSADPDVVLLKSITEINIPKAQIVPGCMRWLWSSVDIICQGKAEVYYRDHGARIRKEKLKLP